MLKQFALVLALSAALTTAGCTSTSNGTAGYAGPSVAQGTKNVAAAKRTLGKARRKAVRAGKRVTTLRERVARDRKRLRAAATKGRAGAKGREAVRERLRRNRAALAKALRTLRSERRGLRLAERGKARAERLVRLAKAGAARAKRVAERRARLAERKLRDGTAGRRTAAWFGSRTGTPRDPALAFAKDYRARNDGGWRLPAIPIETMPKRLLRQEVRYRTRHKPGTVVVDTGARFLYLVQPGGMAMRYGIGVGREGFAWSGEAHVGWKQEWPKWTPPAEMIAREPKLAKYCADCGGMPGGISNPLGARALYLHADGKDTLFRLHGTPEWRSIGTAASSGCIRLINQDVIDLYERVRTGAKVVVM